MSESKPHSPSDAGPAFMNWLRRHPGHVLVALAVVAVGVWFAVVVGLNIAITALLIVAVLVGAGFAQIRRERKVGVEGSASRFLIHAFAAAVAVFAVIQFIPVGRSHSNPAVTGEPQWADPEARELMVRACYGCHSNEVVWPWYSNVAPLSWAINDHVVEGRDAVNYSEFDRPQKDADETVEVILDGSMPPAYYTRFGLHSSANLSDAEVEELVDWLRETPGLSEDEDDSEDDDDDHD